MLIYAPVPVNFKPHAFKSEPIFGPAESVAGASGPPVPATYFLLFRRRRDSQEYSGLPVCWITHQTGAD